MPEQHYLDRSSAVRPGGRYPSDRLASVTEGWTLGRLTPPSSLYGANGIRAGRDGRIYIAQAMGSQISALDISTSEIETISPTGGALVGPDDLAFGPDGTIFATELSSWRVGVIEPNGRTRVLQGDLPAANGITYHQGRLFVDECRHGGRVLEVSLTGGEPRVLVEDVPLANACEVGPDGMLYFPVMGANEIWRVHPDGGAAERVIGNLGTPDAVKFDSGGYIVSTQIATGEVLRIDPRNGTRSVITTIESGLDNLTFIGDRLFVSHIRGELYEVLANGETRAILKGGMTGPLGIEVSDNGEIYVADGLQLYAYNAAGIERLVTRLFAPGWPGHTRDLALAPDGTIVVSTASGEITRYNPATLESEQLAEGLDQPHGLALAWGGAIVVAELGKSRVVTVRRDSIEELATGFGEPRGVAIGPDGDCYISDSLAGSVCKLAGGRCETLVDGLVEPHGLAVHDGALYILDVGAKSVVEFNLATGSRRTLATDLPVGPPPGVVPKVLVSLPPASTPLRPFSGLAASRNGAIFFSADGEGSVLVLRPAPRNSDS